MRSARGRHGQPRRPRHPWKFVIGATCALVVSSCAVGPDTGPGLVPAGDGGGNQSPASSSAVPQIPALQKPRNELDWRECGSRVARDYSTSAPSGVTIECATLPSPIDPDRPGDTVDVALTRARVADTPADAAPLVLTSGSDLPSSRTLLLLAGGAGKKLLTSNPVVAVDRRGIERSGALDCLTRDERSTIRNNGLGGGSSDTSARLTRLSAAASTASDGCTETLSPNQLHFGISYAASDLESLRERWGVDRLGLIGVGEGSDVVIAYTAQYGGRTGRIILDTPTPFGANARDTGANEATGVQAALRTFAQRCSSLPSCAFGANGTQTMQSVLDKGRDGQLGGMSDTDALTAITTALALAPNSPDGINSVASAVAAADRGDTRALSGFADDAASLRESDGQLVAACNDVSGPIGQNEIPGLATTWSKQNPLTGNNSALSLGRCLGWASTPTVNPPNSYPVPPLLLNGTGDSINGGNGISTVNTVLTKAGADSVSVTWEGLGYSVLARSDCAADAVSDYIKQAPLSGPSERGCPT
ncbi:MULTISPECIES: alpha/beta hydrolase [Gordonia]|uniref:alpha/beta hydrolase n=1 Tax=unclassified Gordonia (in: high G+C Gram-positive bacteria) TaxID=2657482 RepID=UPI001E298CED|nr:MULTISPECIES: alpha/beta hydrolase [unclassified Gordonia (in: high G+C Gram-positive bacteria)]